MYSSLFKMTWYVKDLNINKSYTVHCHMFVLCTVTVLICNISIGSNASLYSLSMELREAELFYGKKILMKFVYENMFLKKLFSTSKIQVYIKHGS